MHSSLKELISIASPAISASDGGREALGKWGSIGRELGDTLAIKNGFYCFESALLVRPFRNATAPVGSIEWNSGALWKDRYAGRASDALFFAEDVFGCQFCILDDSVQSFDPETGAFILVCGSLEEWADIILKDYNLNTGYPLAHEWQTRYRALLPGERLLPKTPFVLGGRFDVENLYSANDVDGMLFRASVAEQIRNIPDGTEVTLRIGK